MLDSKSGRENTPRVNSSTRFIVFIEVIDKTNGMPRWNLQRIGHFLEVVQAEGVGKAARRIGMSQPALTASIRKLESEVGFELFDRENRFELTSMGKELLPRAREAVGRIQELERDMELIGGGEAGKVRVGCGPTMADGRVAEAFAQLLNKRPRLGMKVHVAPFQTLRPLLEAQEIDFAIGDSSIGDGPGDFEVIALPEHENLLFCRAGHPLLAKRSISPKDFFSYPVVGPFLPEEAKNWLREHHPDRLAGEVLSLECSHHALLKKVVLGTDAISGAPSEVIADEVERGELVVLKTTMKPIVTRVVVVKLRHRSLAPAAMELIELLVEG